MRPFGKPGSLHWIAWVRPTGVKSGFVCEHWAAGWFMSAGSNWMRLATLVLGAGVVTRCVGVGVGVGVAVGAGVSLNKPAKAVTAKITTTTAVPMAAKTGQRLRRLGGTAGGTWD